MNQSPAATSKNLGLTPMEGVIAGIVVGFVVLSLLFFVAGEVSGVLFKFDRPGTPAQNVLKVAAGVVSNPGDPASAWPTDYQDKIPGPVPYYITLLLLIVGCVGAAKGLRALWQGTKKADQNQAQWARAKDIKTLIVPHAGIRGRLVLGRSNGKLIATEPRQSVIVMGPTQTGKTTGFAVPAILEWDGPVIAASVKNDLVKDTFKWRRTQGEVWLFDPTRSTGFDYEDVRAGWSPLSEAQHWGGARKVASWLCKANKAAGNNLSDGDFWFSAAEKLMAPYLFAAAVGGKDMATVLRWIDINEEREVMAILQRANVLEAKTAFEANMKRDERTKSSIFTTAETIIDAYNDPLVCESASNPTIFSSELLNGGKNTLYICAPSHEQERLQAIFTAIVSQMKSAAYELAGKQNHPVDPPLLICIDEAANIAPLNDLDSIASTAAGIGIQLVTIFQDMAQIEARYKERARTVVNNHRAKVILSGISDTGTLEYVSKLCGEEEIDQQSTSTSAQGEKSTTDSKQQRTLASGAYLRRMKFGEGIVVYGQLSPAKLVLRQWFKDRVLKHMVEFGTKPGVMGGPAGSNSFAGGSTISKDLSSVPAQAAVAADAQYRAGDTPGNQMAQGATAVMDSPETQEMSAFDKALAELRARDAGAPVPASSTAPSVPAPTPIPSTTPSAPSKWKPSGGGVPEESSGDTGGFSAAPASTVATPAVPAVAPATTTTASTTSAPSKWSKDSHPTFSEAPSATTPVSTSALPASEPAQSSSPSKWKPTGVVAPEQIATPVAPVQSVPSPGPVPPAVAPPVPSVPTPAASPATSTWGAASLPLATPPSVPTTPVSPSPGVPTPTPAVPAVSPQVSETFAQYSVSPEKDETEEESPSSTSSENEKRKWK